MLKGLHAFLSLGFRSLGRSGCGGVLGSGHKV